MPETRVRLKLQVRRWRVRRLDPVMEGNMRDAMTYFRDRVKAKVNRPYPPVSRPGEPPRRRTGNYRRSIVAVVGKSQTGKSMVGRVGSDSPYARRLEFGFVGRDSLGRFYNQKPRPHMRSTMEEEAREVARRIAGK